jgi:phosphoglycerol transferase MdoB-like AlkP superfamily enzyme
LRFWFDCYRWDSCNDIFKNKWRSGSNSRIIGDIMEVNQINTVKKQMSGTDSTITVSYKVTLNNGNIYSVPKATDNTDYQAILEWVADGNTIQEAD